MYSDCERVRQWVSAELDSELSEFERALMNGHLAACPACSAFGASAARVTDELRQAPLEPFRAQVEVRRRRRMSFRLAPVAAALAVSAVGLGSILTSSDLRTVFSNGGRTGSAATPLGDSPTNLLKQAQALERQESAQAGRARGERRIAGGPVFHQ